MFLALTISSLEDDKEIHRSDLSEVMLFTVQPEVLSVAFFGGLLLWHNAWGIVCAEFIRTGT